MTPRRRRQFSHDTYPIPDGFPPPLVSLLDRWIERRSGLFSKGFWPELRYVITLTPITWKQRRIAEGVCMERSTTPRPHDRIDEAGYAVASLANLQRDILILSRMGDIKTCLNLIRSSRSAPMTTQPTQNGGKPSSQPVTNTSKPKGVKPHEVHLIDEAWWDYLEAAVKRGLP